MKSAHIHVPKSDICVTLFNLCFSQARTSEPVGRVSGAAEANFPTVSEPLLKRRYCCA
jgi:hypothetical protein